MVYERDMFKNRVSLFRLFGFEVYVDPSWVILAVLITVSLAMGYFPNYMKGFSDATYWWMGLAGALGLFFSIVFHELMHSLVARRYGLPIKGITLFIFGGVAEMHEEPPSSKAEFMMAVAGPLSSILLSILFYAAFMALKMSGFPEPVSGILFYLSFINGLLAIFNLIPGFPLDGGRVLRSVLWSWKGDLRWATDIASRIGSGFGVFLVALGVLNVLGGNFIGGMWWFLIGMFLRGASNASYQQVLIKEILGDEPVSRFMNPDPLTVPPTLSVEELVEDYIYRHHYKMFPVIDGGRVLGCVSTSDVKDVPRSEWKNRTVLEISKECSPENTIGPGVNAIKALSLMNQTGGSRLMVVEGDKLLGLIALKDLMKFLSLKLDLEGESGI